ncbi:hypothetical protein QM480_06680 [Flectobacillus sp. DC10W]|uniref:Uncharacterized protein n=1 Tax=Flectobacillus longus TaxID=2984207 RepID=A0ABT6YKP1_9BACT|nr:hypothetical protein [Flectobacillus longus]MDI9864001.1 hypothetical protein [Flectobacillus longus]
MEIIIVKKDETYTPLVWFWADCVPYMIDITETMINEFWYYDYNNPKLNEFANAVDYLSKGDIHSNLVQIIISNKHNWVVPDDDELEDVFNNSLQLAS